MEDIDEYDKKCKVEPLMRALKEGDTEAWINGRRRDHGAERAALPLWEGSKVGGEICYLITFGLQFFLLVLVLPAVLTVFLSVFLMHSVHFSACCDCPPVVSKGI